MPPSSRRWWPWAPRGSCSSGGPISAAPSSMWAARRAICPCSAPRWTPCCACTGPKPSFWAWISGGSCPGGIPTLLRKSPPPAVPMATIWTVSKSPGPGFWKAKSPGATCWAPCCRAPWAASVMTATASWPSRPTMASALTAPGTTRAKSPGRNAPLTTVLKTRSSRCATASRPLRLRRPSRTAAMWAASARPIWTPLPKSTAGSKPAASPPTSSSRPSR